MRSTTFEKRNGRRSGQRLKQRTLSLFEPSDVYVNRARRGMLVRMLKTGTATADDAYDAANLPPALMRVVSAPFRIHSQELASFAEPALLLHRGRKGTAHTSPFGSYTAVSVRSDGCWSIPTTAT